MSRNWLLGLTLGTWLGALCVTGCSGADSDVGCTVAPPLKTPADPLSKADIELFLQIVQAHPRHSVPEFTPAERDDSIDEGLPADTLVRQFRSRFRHLFDPQRQGQLWAADEEWSKLLAAHQLDPAQFAALVKSVSCAITRTRVERRLNTVDLLNKARAHVAELVRDIDQADELPVTSMTSEIVFQRTRSVLRLNRAIALLEFAELLQQVPADNLKLVRKYSGQLQPLLPAADHVGDPLAALEALNRPIGATEMNASRR